MYEHGAKRSTERYALQHISDDSRFLVQGGGNGDYKVPLKWLFLRKVLHLEPESGSTIGGNPRHRDPRILGRSGGNAPEGENAPEGGILRTVPDYSGMFQNVRTVPDKRGMKGCGMERKDR